jgi:hypothetical protein
MTVEGWRAMLAEGFTQFGPVLQDAERSEEEFFISKADLVVVFDEMPGDEDLDEDVHHSKKARVD